MEQTIVSGNYRLSIGLVSNFAESGNGLSTVLNHNVHIILGYEDDLVILDKGKYKNIVKRRMQQAQKFIT